MSLSGGLAVVLVLLFTMAGCAFAPAAGAPRYRALALQPGDAVTFHDSTDDVTIDITSERGLGSVEIERLGPPPKTVTINLHLKGLEELRYGWGETRLFVHVASSDGSVTEEVSRGTNQPAPIDTASPYWAAVDITAENPKIPLENGYFAIAAPPVFLQEAPLRFTLQWIDFYR